MQYPPLADDMGFIKNEEADVLSEDLEPFLPGQLLAADGLGRADKDRKIPLFDFCEIKIIDENWWK
jgi:hypothetical protein